MNSTRLTMLVIQCRQISLNYAIQSKSPLSPNGVRADDFEFFAEELEWVISGSESEIGRVIEASKPVELDWKSTLDWKEKVTF